MYELFYVGIGSGNRYKSHFCKSVQKKCKNYLKNKRINDLKNSNIEIYIDKIIIDITPKEANVFEMKFISIIGKINNGGYLINVLDGGNYSYYNHDINTKSKISNRSYNYKHSEETKNKISESQKGIKNHRFGKKWNIERKEAFSLQKSNDNNHFYGKKHLD